jgi:DNA-binding response OmpR family regulator
MDQAPRILVVDDEQDLREILEFNLASEGFEIETAASAEEALKLPLEQYDLILLDVMMGGMTGYRMADLVRNERNLKVPIIFLTARDTENDLLTGFNVGGDDYIAKPFSLKEVVVRIKAVLKRGQGSETRSDSLKYKGLKLDDEKKRTTVDKQETNLTRKEFQILALLLRNRGKFISREEILESVWTRDVVVTDRNVDVNITRLRKKIGKYGTCIKGRSGYGYSFQED